MVDDDATSINTDVVVWPPLTIIRSTLITRTPASTRSTSLISSSPCVNANTVAK